MKPKNSQTIVIGLDGATFDIILPMVKEGKLPAFKRLMKEGAWGELESTIPPITPPAWVSFMTGKNPGKHGVFGFFSVKPGSHDTIITTRHSIKTKKIWEYLDDDKKIGLMDIPMTYPPEKVNGYMISGIPIPSEETVFTYPPELHTELISEIDDYMIDTRLRILTEGSSLIEGLKLLYEHTNMRMKAIRYFFREKGPFDFFMAVFRGTDFLAHEAFKYLDSDYAQQHPEEARKYGKTIFQYYEKIDQCVSEVMEIIDKNATLILMSDHGSGPLKRLFYINRWLRREGFIKLIPRLRFRKISIRTGWKKIEEFIERAGLSSLNCYIPGSVRKIKLPYFVPYKTHPLKLIDWDKTVAYTNFQWAEGSIRINLKGREPDGIVTGEQYDIICDEIVDKLKKLVDPLTGKTVMEAVYRRDEIYSGPYVNEAPDIIALARNVEYAYRTTLSGNDLFETPQIPEPALHRMNGIFLASGPHVKKGSRLTGLHITDIAPTILHLMGYEIPVDMDGKVIVNAMDETYLISNPVAYCEDSDKNDTGDDHVDFDPREREAIEKTLRHLGYMT